jgi:large subunit ribosomal protein L31
VCRADPLESPGPAVGIRVAPGVDFSLQCRSFHRRFEPVMKPDIHPNNKPVVFQDLSSDFAFLTKSTMSSKETIKWEDGNEYPLIKVDISSHSHPFYTGKQKSLDVGGRVDKFRRRYAGSVKE